MRDQAGNYIFEANGDTFSIMRMGWKQQRNIIGKLQSIVDADGNIMVFSDGFNSAQDYLMPMIRHNLSETTFQYLDDDYLDDYLDRKEENAIVIVNEIFVNALMELNSNFFQNESPQKNSNQDVGENSESINSQNKLSQTLQK